MDEKPAPAPAPESSEPPATPAETPEPAREVGGRPGPDPTRYGDWEVGGIAVDF